ncbi:hypothetical protein [Sulfurisoma sediminicola]|uniref:PsiF repeat-containing protein n=1 Tax=Sulfurisoma sediminicola TaxID=1381557 RepID=A0A497XIX5_9PROT|nr:hypothetical protein [Sulfurisoma sediminicola]RLJ67851.1 hypothetical protein DFR35_0401 [Sulfurisoma sediminicola]
MTHQQNRLLVGIAICLLSSIAVAAAPTDAKAPVAAAPAPEAKLATAPEAAPAQQARKRVHTGSDARKCLKQPDNKGVRRCAEKFR